MGLEKVGSWWGNTCSREGQEAKEGVGIVWGGHHATGCSEAAVGVRSWPKLAARKWAGPGEGAGPGTTHRLSRKVGRGFENKGCGPCVPEAEKGRAYGRDCLRGVAWAVADARAAAAAEQRLAELGCAPRSAAAAATATGTKADCGFTGARGGWRQGAGGGACRGPPRARRGR